MNRFKKNYSRLWIDFTFHFYILTVLLSVSGAEVPILNLVADKNAGFSKIFENFLQTKALLSEKEKKENPSLQKFEEELSSFPPLDQRHLPTGPPPPSPPRQPTQTPAPQPARPPSKPARRSARLSRQTSTSRWQKRKSENEVDAVKNGAIGEGHPAFAATIYAGQQRHVSNAGIRNSGEREHEQELFSGDDERKAKSSYDPFSLDVDATESLVKPSNFKPFTTEENEVLIDHTKDASKTSLTCERNGKRHPLGWHFRADDGCNLCFCELNATVTCTVDLCGCHDKNGIFREARESWSDPLDPCNVCSCRIGREFEETALPGNHYAAAEQYRTTRRDSADVVCIRMTLVECYMRISARRQREQRFKHFLLKKGYRHSRYKIP